MMTAPGVSNIVFEQGTGFEYSLVYNNPDQPDGQPGSPIDLTSYNARLHVAVDLINKTPILLFATDGSSTPGCSLTLGGPSGTIVAIATSEATSAMNFITGVYALFLEPPAADV